MRGFKEKKVFSNSAEMAGHVGTIWRELQSVTEKDFFVSVPLSSTPLPLYSWVVENALTFENWGKFNFVLMDEQVKGRSSFSYVDKNDAASFEGFARKNFLEKLEGKVERRFEVLKPDLNNLGGFDGFIDSKGGLDLLVLAIGVKGHYAQVMPGTSKETGFHVSRLLPEMIAQHTSKESKSYPNAAFNEYGMSLGPKHVLTAKNVVVIISGEKKKHLVRELFSYSSFDAEFPLSIIFHDKVKSKTRVFLTEECVS